MLPSAASSESSFVGQPQFTISISSASSSGKLQIVSNLYVFFFIFWTYPAGRVKLLVGRFVPPVGPNPGPGLMFDTSVLRNEGIHKVVCHRFGLKFMWCCYKILNRWCIYNIRIWWDKNWQHGKNMTTQILIIS